VVDQAPSLGFGLYVHWPFCVSKCPYCDFNSHVRASIDEDRWKRAYLQELDRIGTLTRGRTLTSVFFGGGTPSLMSPHLVEGILSKLSHYWTLSPTLEITLEANPNSVEVQKFQDFKQAGINRVSLGVQSLRDESLKFLGRAHKAEEAISALKIMTKLFERYSFDLIYARPNQSLADWRAELGEALSLAGQHLSLYQLTIEPGTAFYTAYNRGDWALPDEEASYALYDTTYTLLKERGLNLYEVSNFATPGAESRHNLLYWRYEDYAPLGPGAHGRITQGKERSALKSWKAPETWLNAVDAGSGVEESLILSKEDQFTEFLLMGMRLREGIERRRFESDFCVTPEMIWDPDDLKSLSEEGLLEQSSTHFKPTRAGLYALNSVLSFLAQRQKVLVKKP
jgi:putative oxygen-independent coproporphyrinogen III oxidase